MTETARFFDAVSYSEADQADFNMRMLRPVGIFPDSSLGVINVTATNGNMTVTVTPGEAHVQGFQYKNDANKVLTIAANPSGGTRIDRVVLRLDRAANALTAVVLQGVSGAGVPALTQTALGIYEFPLYQISVAVGATNIVVGNITDQRAYSRWADGALNFNSLSPLVPRAHGKVNGGAVTTFNGQGIASITVLAGIGKVITWSAAFANGNYTCLIVPSALDGTGAMYRWYIASQAAGSVLVTFYDTAGVVQHPEFMVLALSQS